MVSLPPQTSHRLQPLDLTFFSPLKSAFYRECDFYLTSTGHTKITEYDVAELLNKAFVKVAKISTAGSGFRTSGICPFNPEKFSDDDFDAARKINVQPISVEMMDGSVNLDSPDQTKASSEGNGSKPNLSQQIEQSEKISKVFMATQLHSHPQTKYKEFTLLGKKQ